VATKADFTEDEWKTMQRGVTGAGTLTSVADADFTDTFGEASALAKYLAEQRRSSDSALVRDLASVHGTGFGLTASRDEVEAGTLAALRAAVATLEAKAPDELAAYRELVTGLAEHVAEAKTGVKPAESDAMAKISEALGISPTV
jgi:hypothetical protein